MPLTTIDISNVKEVRLYAMTRGLTLKAYVNNLITRDMSKEETD